MPSAALLDGPSSGEMRILVDTHQQGVRAGIRVHEIRLSAIAVLRDEKRQQSTGDQRIR
jgi:hypothetical protein